MSQQPTTACIGGGPAGLTAAYQLSALGMPVFVLEAEPRYLGGIARTVVHEGFGLDIGGHRFFTNSARVNTLWHELLGDDFMHRQRKSRIYYNGRFFDYPLRASNALFNLGIINASMCMLSYVRALLQPIKSPSNFEQFMCNRFGHRLYSIFFKSYTEKVWGMPCTSISADWAAQRIKDFSLKAAIREALLGHRSKAVHTTLIDAFHYPRKGCGMMWERMGEKIVAQGGQIHMGQRVVALHHEHGKWDIITRDTKDKEHHYHAARVVSSQPMRELIGMLTPRLNAKVLTAAQALGYRDFMVVALLATDRHTFDDNWIYIHDPQVKVGRIQNMKAWSPEMIPDAQHNCYGMEYFCFEGDALWNKPDRELIAFATAELVKLGLAKQDDVHDGFVVRQPKAYPVYDHDYANHVDTIRAALAATYPSLHLVGRNGMHRYNNQDHSMLTAMLTVENIVAGQTIHDVWHINSEAAYHEEDDKQGERLTPLKQGDTPESCGWG